MLLLAVASGLPVLAAGWAFLYYLLGGGLGGAFLIFVVLKMVGR
jgi:hypothetical protein